MIFVFTGQGSFKPGFGRQFLKDPTFKRHFEEVSDLVATDLGAFAWGKHAACAPGKGAELQVTHFALSWALAHALANRIGEPELGLGHSLGELCALIFAGGISLPEGARMIKERGAFMDKARGEHPQDMLAVACGNETWLEAMIAEHYQGKVFISNLNTSTQTVLSGELGALRDCSARLGRLQINATLLGTGLAFHSPLLEEAARGLTPVLRQLAIRPPVRPFFSVAANRLLKRPNEIRKHLENHLLGRVDWRRAMKTLFARFAPQDPPVFCEIGSAKVLKNLFMAEQASGGVPAGWLFRHCTDYLA